MTKKQSFSREEFSKQVFNSLKLIKNDGQQDHFEVDVDSAWSWIEDKLKEERKQAVISTLDLVIEALEKLQARDALHSIFFKTK